MILSVVEDLTLFVKLIVFLFAVMGEGCISAYKGLCLALPGELSLALPDELSTVAIPALTSGHCQRTTNANSSGSVSKQHSGLSLNIPGDRMFF